MMLKRSPLRSAAALFAGLVWWPTLTLADGNRLMTAPAIYKTECGSCHTPYPAGLLMAAAWKKTTDKLSTHFGVDASLTPAEVQEISAYLQANAGARADRYEAPKDPPRLTQTAWFERKHLQKLPASVWKDPKVKSASHCAACHTGADQGNYAERDIAVPGFPGRHW